MLINKILSNILTNINKIYNDVSSLQKRKSKYNIKDVLRVMIASSFKDNSCNDFADNYGLETMSSGNMSYWRSKIYKINLDDQYSEYTYLSDIDNYNNADDKQNIINDNTINEDNFVIDDYNNDDNNDNNENDVNDDRYKVINTKNTYKVINTKNTIDIFDSINDNEDNDDNVSNDDDDNNVNNINNNYVSNNNVDSDDDKNINKRDDDNDNKNYDNNKTFNKASYKSI